MLSLFLALLFILQNDALHDFRGRVIDNNEWLTPLYGASIQLAGTDKITASNVQGYFTLKDLSPGDYEITISFVGYKTLNTNISLPQNSEAIFYLEAESIELDDILVSAIAEESSLIAQNRTGSIDVAALPIVAIPRLLGEPDLIRVIQNLPGVKTESDFTGGFIVRGGRNDQNLILLDGVPIYNPWHLFGLFSAFNSEAIKNVELSKSIFPAQYGGKISSVLDISLQEGAERLGAGFLTISPLSTSFSYGRPVNQKTSYLFALRRTYMDPVFWIMNSFMTREVSTPTGTEKVRPQNKYGFADYNFKITHRFNQNLKLSANLFRNDDNLNFGEKTSTMFFDEFEENELDLILGWNNTAGSIRVEYFSKGFSTTLQPFITIYRSNYTQKFRYNGIDETSDDKTFILAEEFERQSYSQDFIDLGLRHDFSFHLHQNINLNTGWEWINHRFEDRSAYRFIEYGYPFNPDGSRPNPPPPLVNVMRSEATGDSIRTNANEISFYINSSIRSKNFSFYPGLRVTRYEPGGYTHILPRINAEYRISENIFATAGYGHFSQYLHVLGLDLVRVPTERWIWSNGSVKPATARSTTLGIGYNYDPAYTLRIEGYFKEMKGLKSFSPLQQTQSSDNLTIPRFGSETIDGSGESYGLEILWQKNSGIVAGWIGYTLSWSWNSFDGLNNGLRFPSRTDKRHDLQAFWSWNFSTNWDLGILFNFKSGQPITFSTGRHLPESDPLEIGENGGSNQVVLETNNFRLPDYHRLDLNLTWKNRNVFRRKAELSLNIINVYNRLNPLTVISDTNIEPKSGNKLQINPNNNYFGQLPILPVLSLRVALGGDAL